MRQSGRKPEAQHHDTSKGIARGLGAVDEAYARAQVLDQARQNERKTEKEKNQLMKEAAESYMRMVIAGLL